MCGSNICSLLALTYHQLMFSVGSPQDRRNGEKDGKKKKIWMGKKSGEFGWNGKGLRKIRLVYQAKILWNIAIIASHFNYAKLHMYHHFRWWLVTNIFYIYLQYPLGSQLHLTRHGWCLEYVHLKRFSCLLIS